MQKCQRGSHIITLTGECLCLYVITQVTLAFVAKSSFELKIVPVERTREKTDWFTTGLGVPQSHLIPSWEHISLLDFLQLLGV